MKAESEPSCPMCRSNIYFKGMSKVTEQWELESDDQKWADAYSEAVTDLLDGVDDCIDTMGETILEYIKELETAYKNLRELHDAGYEFSWDYIMEILMHPYCFTDIIIKRARYEIWDDFESIRRHNIFVSRCPRWRGLRI
tara:strand:+ start:1393 stop:1812 length:420 start_codon:yes stop_codon:yes gene_type:complete